jgi:alanine dehydrogenase
VRVGVPKEIKDGEDRIAITPAGTHELVAHGHRVLVEEGAGAGSMIADDELVAAGAKLAGRAEQVWSESDLVLKVKEPVGPEFDFMRPGQVLFTYLHLAASRACTQGLLDAGVVAFGYETVQLADGSLPLLAPMSEVAGRMAAQVGAHHLQRDGGGRGVLMGGVSGVHAARVAVLGAGVSGMNAAAIAVGMQAEVLLLDTNVAKLREADRVYQGRVQTIASNRYEVRSACLGADLVIGAVLVPGAKAPVLVDDDLVAAMRPGSVLVDIAVDQGGCFASTHATTHAKPTFMVGGCVFYCVANMPGAVPHTSTYALTNVTLPYVLAIADGGWEQAVRADPALAGGVNAVRGRLTLPPVAATHGLTAVPLDEALAQNV